MIGMIITGHGTFAEGLTSAIELLAGPQQDYKVVNFDGNNFDGLEHGLRDAMSELTGTCDGVIVFSDLPGGTPFKSAVLASQDFQNVKVIAGTNMPMLAEITVARTCSNDLNSLVETALSAGKDNVVKFELQVPKTPQDLGGGI